MPTEINSIVIPQQFVEIAKNVGCYPDSLAIIGATGRLTLDGPQPHEGSLLGETEQQSYYYLFVTLWCDLSHLLNEWSDTYFGDELANFKIWTNEVVERLAKEYKVKPAY